METMKAHTLETQKTITPSKAIQILQAGNIRFVNNLKVNRDLLEQVNATREGQWPFATILSCIDSRVSSELVFDQGLGDIFSIRIAGNYINQDILGSMEFACNIANSKLIVVLGHTKCGALKGGLDLLKLKGSGMENLEHLLQKFEPSIHQLLKEDEERSSSNKKLLDDLTVLNVEKSMAAIRQGSATLKELEDAGKIKIVGAVYDVESGVVTWI